MELDTMKQMVIEASTTFYSTKDKETRRSAEEWLNNFKKSVHAWYITDQILHTDKNEQVLFFAAQTIRSKIQYNFHELPVDSHEVSQAKRSAAPRPQRAEEARHPLFGGRGEVINTTPTNTSFIPSKNDVFLIVI